MRALKIDQEIEICSVRADTETGLATISDGIVTIDRDHDPLPDNRQATYLR